MNSYQISLSEATEGVTNLCQAGIDMFMAQIDRLPTFSPEVDQDLTHYIALLQDLVRDTLDWHFVTDRYRQH